MGDQGKYPGEEQVLAGSMAIGRQPLREAVCRDRERARNPHAAPGPGTVRRGN